MNGTKKKAGKGRAGAPRLAAVSSDGNPASSSKTTNKAARSVTESARSLIDLDTVRELARIIGEFDLTEVEADPSGHVRVRRELGAAMGGAPAAFAPSSLALAPPVEAPAEAGIFVTSPFVGTFYRAPSPEAASFAEVGQTVRKGQVVCIVEAMKLMNEIESEADGKVLEILVQNGEHVEYGQPLMRLAKS